MLLSRIFFDERRYIPCRAKSVRLLWMKLGCLVFGEPSFKRAERNRCICCVLVRCTSISRASALILETKNVLMLFPCRWCGKYIVCVGSVFIRLSLCFSLFCTVLSMSLQRSWVGCEGSGLKLIRVFRSVLWIYVVVFALRCLLVVVESLDIIFFFMRVLVGEVFPSMLRRVPKCLLWGGVGLSIIDVEVCTCTSMVVSSGVWVRKLQAKLLNFGRFVPGGALWMYTQHFEDFLPSLTTRERSPAHRM